MKGHEKPDPEKSFSGSDLALFEELLYSQAEAVVPMRDVVGGWPDRVIAVRHDVDWDLDAAVKMARWEAKRGVRSTFYLLHTAYYWHGGRHGDKTIYARRRWPRPKKQLARAVKEFEALGHEVGLHSNAVAAGFGSGVAPSKILAYELDQLRSLGADVVGTAGHGDPVCRGQIAQRSMDSKKEGPHPGPILFVNSETYTECPHPRSGPPDRTIVATMEDGVTYSVTLDPMPLSYFGLLYDTARLAHRRRYSDAASLIRVIERGVVSQFDTWDQVSLSFPDDGPLCVFLHPDWWGL